MTKMYKQYKRIQRIGDMYSGLKPRARNRITTVITECSLIHVNGDDWRVHVLRAGINKAPAGSAERRVLVCIKHFTDGQLERFIDGLQ